MRFSLLVSLVIVFAGLSCFLNYILLVKTFPVYRRRTVCYGYWLISGGAILITYYSRVHNPLFLSREAAYTYWLVYAGLAWLFGQIALLILQPVLYPLVKLLRGRNEPVPGKAGGISGLSVTRRSFLQGAAALPFLSLGVGIEGIYQAQQTMEVRRHNLKLTGLPQDLKNFRIAQVSDTHLGPYFSLERLEAVIQLLRQEKPDIVLITGDLVDDLSLLAPALARLDRLAGEIRHGIYFCWGNHEYMRNIGFIRDKLRRSRITLLENESRLIVPGPQPFYLLGVDYPGSAVAHAAFSISAYRRRQCFAATCRDLPADAFAVLMAHHPDFLYDGFAAGIPLTLAGHTHGGQIAIGGYSFLQPAAYMRGMYCENGVYGYVSSGAGHWFPLRLGCPPEICLFTLIA